MTINQTKLVGVRTTQAWTKATLLAGATLAALSVAIGAFAAHGLKALLETYALGIIETAARYQMYHALALLALGCLYQVKTLDLVYFKRSALCFFFGVVFFSGSLYWLAFSAPKVIAFFTPLGGLLFLLGWLYLIIGVVKTNADKGSEDV